MERRISKLLRPQPNALRVFIFTCFLLAFHPLGWAEEGKSCGQLFHLIDKFGKTLTASKFAYLREGDPRYAWNNLRKRSAILEEIDNFVSPATQELMFSKRLSNEAYESLAEIAKQKSLVATLARDAGVELESNTGLLLEDIEKRIRLSSAILNSACKAKNALCFSTQRENANNTVYLMKKSLEELSNSNSVDSSLLPNKLLDFLKSEKYSLKQIDEKLLPKAFSEKLVAEDFKPEFLMEISPDNSHLNELSNASQRISGDLENVPVGISYKIGELTGTVRYGKKHVYAGYGGYEALDRNAYEHFPKGGLIDSEFNLSNEKKKSIALSLDRQTQTLDSFFGLGATCDRTFHLCGSFAPTFFIRHGVPVLPGGIGGSPSVTMIGQAIQRTLRLPHMKNFRMSKFGTNTFVHIPLLVLHDGMFGQMETAAVYGIVIYGAKRLSESVVYLVNGDGEKEYKLSLNDQGQVTSMTKVD